MGQLAGRRVSLLALLLLLSLLCAQSALAQQDDETEQYPNERFKRVSRASTRRRSRSTGFFHRQRPVADPVDSTDGPVVHVEAPASPSPSPLPSPAAPASGNDTAAAPAEAKNATTGGSIAEIIDQALIAEFDGDSKKIESEAGKEFNSTVENEEVSGGIASNVQKQRCTHGCVDCLTSISSKHCCNGAGKLTEA